MIYIRLSCLSLHPIHFNMEKHLHTPVVRFALWGFIASLGAPIGFYLHDFFFNPVAKSLFWENVAWIHKHNAYTIVYICLGTNIFFSVFGAIIGKYSLKLNEAYRTNQHIKQTKQDLIKHFLSQMRISSIVGLESLFHLKDGEFTAREKDNLLQLSINELIRVDEYICNLLALQGHKTEEDNFLNHFEIADLIKSSSEKHEMQIGANRLLMPQEDFHVKLSTPHFMMAMDQLFGWIKYNEIELAHFQMSCFNSKEGQFIEHREKLSQLSGSPLIICLVFKVTGQEQLIFEAPFLVDFIETCKGICFYHNGSVLIFLPTETFVEEAERVKAA